MTKNDGLLDDEILTDLTLSRSLISRIEVEKLEKLIT